ncbi:MAG: hypothetical protein M1812_002245 [Candelaria pacifica]|nr:MAG: hypothetical protein M1812_002245 [Candelaria pacifica]
MTSNESTQALQIEIEDLKTRLQSAESKLVEVTDAQRQASVGPPHSLPSSNSSLSPHFHHAMLLLSDSALPLGSFAFSSGLESYLAHHRHHTSPSLSPIASFHRFLKLSLGSLSSTTIPYILAAHRHPSELETLDNDIDASIPCTVARRASVAQGKALLSVWDRCFRSSVSTKGGDASSVGVLEEFRLLLKAPADEDGLVANGHFAPIWGVISEAMGLSLEQTAYVFMFNHVKAVLSAAVRASVMGPYQAQAVLANNGLQEMLSILIQKEWTTKVRDAGQVCPVMDLWVGRHELLYSRIFNS